MKKYVFLLCFLLIQISYAMNDTEWQKAGKAITGLDSALMKIKKHSSLPLLFPADLLLPLDTPKYYAYVDLENTSPYRYMISIDRTADCHGAKYCSVGYVQAEVNGNPVINYDKDNHEITTKVSLAKRGNGYFTPGHALADYWPPMLVWRQGNVLYTLSWQIANKDPDAQLEVLSRMVKEMKAVN